MRQTIFKDAVQLSLFADPLENLTDDEILATIADRPRKLCDTWVGDYRMEEVYQRLTPAKRKVAEAAVELYRRSRAKRQAAPIVRSSRDAEMIIRPYVEHLEVEEFWVIALNHAARVLGLRRLSIGGISSTMVDIRVLFRSILKLGAVQFIVVHNHPSGNLKPSPQDKGLTANIKNAAKVLEMRLMDHLIVTAEGYLSFNDEGLL